MLDKTIIEKKRLDEYEPLKSQLESLRYVPFDPFSKQNQIEGSIQEYILFEQNEKIIGITYIEGMKDTKNCSLFLVTGQSEHLIEIIEESTNYAINDLEMLDVNWLTTNSYDIFLEIAKKNNYEISPPDPDIVVLSRSIQKELEQRKNR